jgi:hypothetical protein
MTFKQTVKKCLNLTFKNNFQSPKSFDFFQIFHYNYQIFFDNFDFWNNTSFLTAHLKVSESLIKKLFLSTGYRGKWSETGCPKNEMAYVLVLDMLPNDFLPFVIYMVQLCLGNKKLHFLLISWSSKNGNYIFQSLNHVDINLKLQFLIKISYHIVPSPSTTLQLTLVLKNPLLRSWYPLHFELVRLWSWLTMC